MKMKNKGFTLIEIMVAVSIFTIVMMISMGAVFSVVGANRKSQSLNVVVNNLNFAFESMIRDLRTGTGYEVSDCVGISYDCRTVTFEDREGRRVSYGQAVGGVIFKEYTEVENSNLPQGGITDPEVTIENMSFDLLGGNPSGDGSQLLLRIHLQGKTGNPANNTESAFNIQTLIAPRSLDSTEF